MGMSGVARKRSKMVADEVPYLVGEDTFTQSWLIYLLDLFLVPNANGIVACTSEVFA